MAYQGTYVSAGAIASPIVELDLRTIYLNELRLIGSTGFSHDEFKDLITYIESKKIKPIIAKTYPLENIHQAQKDFLDKIFFGKACIDPIMRCNFVSFNSINFLIVVKIIYLYRKRK